MEVMLGHKQTEVGAKQDDWRDCDISDLCGLQRGFDITEATRKAGDVPVYSSSGLSYFHSEARLKPPAVITGRKGILGKVFLVQEPCWPHDTTLWVKDFKGNDPRFVYWFLIQFRLERFDAATSVPTLNRHNLVGIPIKLPPLPEQRVIAGALSDLDAMIGALDQLIAKKRDLKQAAMQQLLTGQKRLPGFHGEWEVKRLGEIATLYQPVTISAKLFTESGYPVYGANGVVGFYHDFNHARWQVTVTCRGSTCGTVNRTVEKCWVTGNAMVVNCDQNKDINKDFLYYVLLNQDLSVCITGTGQPQIVRGPLANVELSIPRGVAEQTAIAGVLSDMDAELAALEQRRDKTRALKQGMMQELLTGRTRLVDSGKLRVDSKE